MKIKYLSTLLTEYNPKFINTKIKAITMQIEMMYHLNISRMTTSESSWRCINILSTRKVSD